MEKFLAEDKPLIGSDKYWLDVFRDLANLTTLINFVTDPLLTEPYAFFDDKQVKPQITGYKPILHGEILRNGYPQPEYLVRSYQTLIFLTEPRNFRLVHSSNLESMGSICNSIFFTSSL